MEKQKLNLSLEDLTRMHKLAETNEALREALEKAQVIYELAKPENLNSMTQLPLSS